MELLRSKHTVKISSRTMSVKSKGIKRKDDQMKTENRPITSDKQK